MRLRAMLLVAIVAAAAVVPHARADTPAWAAGVTDANKAKAKRLLEDGNGLFLEHRYAAAMEKYQAALAAWDHPAIRFNLVRCLIQLDRPVEAADNLRRALRYGPAALEDAVYAEAIAYDKLLAGQVAAITVRCTQPGVRVTLDGDALGTCPMAEPRRVKPGTHQLVGTKDGLLTRALEVGLIGGRSAEVTLTLDPLDRAARIEHRWPGWMPWTVFASGFVVAGFGGLLDLTAATQRDSYDRVVQQKCAIATCDPQTDLTPAERALSTSARRTSRIAVGVIAIGGAAIATGAALLYLNRGRTVYPSALERWSPTVTQVPGGATLTLAGAF